MAIVRRALSTLVVQLFTLITYGLKSPAITLVDAFTSIFIGTKLVDSTHNRFVGRGHQTQLDTSRTRLWGIRDWRSTNNEPQKIYDFLSARREQEAGDDFFDPEGSLELDVLNEWSIKESYSKDDGGCFLVAVKGECSESDENETIEIVGTLGMISGTKVSYKSSGSSISEPEITAAIRRVCASRVDDDSISRNELIRNTSATILKELIEQAEQRALKAGATYLIGIAYPEKATTYDKNSDEKRKDIAKPTASLFESLGYRISEQQIPGVETVQYEKRLSRAKLRTETKSQVASSTMRTTATKPAQEKWIVLTTITSILSLGFLVFNLYSNVFGIEQLWGSIDNGGIGTSLSTQNLEELIRNEKLGRPGLDDGIDSTTTRRWEDLSPEELREEQALMKVIQGESIRSK